VRLEALKPDAEKICAYGIALMVVPMPELSTSKAGEFMDQVKNVITDVANKCNSFNEGK